MKSLLSLVALLWPALSAAQSRPDLYQCEGCEAIRERAPASLTSSVSIAGASEPGERMVLSGRIVKPDGRTPGRGS
jgi:protocatechuate 3,4-dioxygenase beta subunit